MIIIAMGILVTLTVVLVTVVVTFLHMYYIEGK